MSGQQQISPKTPSGRSSQPAPAASTRQGNETELEDVKMTPIQMRQERARKALESLQAPSIDTAQKWTTENHKLLGENIGYLLNVKSGPPTGPPQSPKATGQGQKRAHEVELESAKEPDPNGQTAENQQPLKKLRLRRGGMAEAVPLDITQLKPQPIRLNLKPHPPGDRDDTWFTRQFSALYTLTRKFATDYFAIYDLDEGEFHQPWAVPMNPEFLTYAAQVAAPDPGSGSWDMLLRDAEQRKWLVMAILVRILEVKVFSEPLWGVNKEERELLHGLDRAFLGLEGFARSELRSHTVRTIVGEAPTTENFHRDVAHLTAQVFLLLKPLVDFLSTVSLRDGITSAPLIRKQYQALHNIISAAAYLSICMRLSPTIFFFSSVTPGTPYDPDEQHCLNLDIYTQSKKAVTDAWRTEVTQIQGARAAADKEVQKLQREGRGDSRAGRRAKRRLQKLPVPTQTPALTHRAMAKIGVWPSIRRFKAGSEKEDEERDKQLPQKDGFRILDISKSGVLCYFGREIRAGEDKGGVRLRDFVREKRVRFGVQDVGLGRNVLEYGGLLVGLATVAGIPCLLMPERFKEKMGGYLGEKLVDWAMSLASKIA